MQTVLLRLFIYSSITVIVFYIFWNSTSIKQISPLGNVLSAYVYCTNANCNRDVQNAIVRHTKTVSDQQLKQVYAELSWGKQLNNFEFNSPEELAWQQMTPEGKDKPNYLSFWQAVRPILQDLYARTLPSLNVSSPVVHLRCSDIPFIRHNYYHIPRASTAEWMAKQLRDRGYNQVTMLFCDKHRRIRKNNCNTYANFYAQIFTRNGIRVTKQCSAVVNDFATMYHAPILLSLNASSFAFMAGVAKDPQNYIAANMGVEYDGKYYPQTAADWILSDEPPLLHSVVDDYYNDKHMIQLLETSCG